MNRHVYPWPLSFLLCLPRARLSPLSLSLSSLLPALPPRRTPQHVTAPTKGSGVFRQPSPPGFKRNLVGKKPLAWPKRAVIFKLLVWSYPAQISHNLSVELRRFPEADLSRDQLYSSLEGSLGPFHVLGAEHVVEICP